MTTPTKFTTFLPITCAAKVEKDGLYWVVTVPSLSSDTFRAIHLPDAIKLAVDYLSDKENLDG